MIIAGKAQNSLANHPGAGRFRPRNTVLIRPYSDSKKTVWPPVMVWLLRSPVNTVSVTSTTADPVSGNNSSNWTTTVFEQADLAVTKTGPATDTAGTQISYTIGVSHVGGTSNASGRR